MPGKAAAAASLDGAGFGTCAEQLPSPVHVIISKLQVEELKIKIGPQLLGGDLDSLFELFALGENKGVPMFMPTLHLVAHKIMIANASNLLAMAGTKIPAADPKVNAAFARVPRRAHMRSVVVIPCMANTVGVNPCAGTLRILLVEVSQHDPGEASRMKRAHDLKDQLFPINFFLMTLEISKQHRLHAGSMQPSRQHSFRNRPGDAWGVALFKGQS